MIALRIAAHELRYTVRSVPALVAFTTLLGFAAQFMANGLDNQLTAHGGNILINAPTTITLFMLFASVGTIFFAPTFMATAILKDKASRFDGILFSTPIGKYSYLFGRFLGAFGALLLVMAAAPIGMLLGSLWPWAAAEALGPTNIGHYLVAFFGFLVPSLFLIAATIFAAAALGGSMLYAYMAALGLFLLFIAGMDSESVSPLLDPSLVNAFNDRIRYWTAAELNSRMIEYSGPVLLNRIIWLSVALSLFALACLRFNFRVPAKQQSASAHDTKTDTTLRETALSAGYRDIRKWGFSTHLWQFFARTRFEARAILWTQPFLLLVGFSLFVLVLALTDRTILYGVNALPVTRLMVVGISDALVWALFIVTIFYGADIVWRDRETRFSDLTDASPTPNWVFVLSKLVALVIVIYSILLLGLIVALAIQASGDFVRPEFGLYAMRLFLFSTTFVFLSVLSVFFQTLTKSRFLGIALMGLFWAVSFTSIGVMGVEHPLLRYAVGTVPAPLSDMNGFGRFSDAELWVRAYYSAAAGILVMLTYLLWNRGTLQPLRYRLKRLKALRRPGFLLPLEALVLLFVGSGSYVFYNTNILNVYRTRDDQLALQVAYETQYRQYESLPMPRIVAVTLDVDIYPDRLRVETRGNYVLENKTGEEIRTVHFSFRPNVSAVPHLAVNGATLASRDELNRYYIFNLETPMAPGEQRTLTFETLIESRGFRHRGGDLRLAKNGTFLENRDIAPHVGFNPGLMISDRNTRRDVGLPPLPRMPKLEDASQYTVSGWRKDSDFLRFEATLSTTEGQTAVAPGYLESEWSKGGRHYFVYRMDEPILNAMAFVSADYESLKDDWNGVELEILYHKPHSYNVARMMEGMKDALTYFSEAFGPYPFRQLRILETPAYRRVAKSFPNMITYSEDLGFLADTESGGIDVPYYVTAHEVAHQWWANQVMPANTQGANVLTETLAQYSALLVMEREYGRDGIRRFLKYELDAYLEGRDGDAEGEVPLYRAEGQDYLHYRKGAMIMYALRDYLGEDVVNRALRRLLNDYAFRADPYPTTLTLLTYLREEAGTEYNDLMADFFEKITFYDVEVTDSRVTPLEDGRFKVTLGLSATKYYADEVGNQYDATFDIPVDIGLFLRRPDASGFGPDDVLLFEKRQVPDGLSTMEFVLDQEPAIVGIDPYNKLIGRDTEDNLRPVARLGHSGGTP